MVAATENHWYICKGKKDQTIWIENPSEHLNQHYLLQCASSMLSGSTVTTAWHVLGLRIEETASRSGGQLRIYWISSRGQTTVGGPPAWGLVGGLTTLPCKTQYLLRITTHSLGTGRITWQPRRRWEDGIRMDLRETGLGVVDWIRLAHDRDRWRAVESAVMNLRVLVPWS
jgi:hypothetical protein